MGDLEIQETTPLKEPEKEGGRSFDVDKFLVNSLRIRLPLMNKEGAFGPPPPRQKKPKGSMKKDKVKAKEAGCVDTVKEQAGEAKGDCFPDGITPGLPTLPTIAGITASAKKYGPDLVTNVTYAGVAFILAAMGPTGHAAGRALQEEETQFNVGQVKIIQKEANAEVGAAHNQLLEYWVIFMGAVTSIAMILKSVRFIVNSLFELIDMIEDKINAAIDVLQKELTEEISEALDDAMDDAPKTPFTGMAQKAATQGLVGPISAAIDNAQKNLDVNAMLPWIVSRRWKMYLGLGAPGVIAVAAKCVVNLQTGQGVAGQHRNLSAEYDVLGYQGPRQLLSVKTMEGSLHQLKPMLITLLINALVAYLCSTPVVRVVSNTAVRGIQKATNSFILGTARDTIPGGVENLQTVVDTALNPTGALSNMAGRAKRGCEVM